ncbi:MAG: hypothetical protein KF699_07320 [Phycisphaeraceae bacterium]|nr:hypothetical protein [Phycisphaeraceae bacterium]MBX3405165.1 hypothetical protein [Phycisphaeraceae bacterium]
MSKRSAMLMLLASVLLVLGAAGMGARPSQPADAAAGQPARARFIAVDVFVDSGAAALAAWQVEVRLGAGAKLAGVEGGETAGVYAAPPTYDPAALMNDRVIIASFSLEDAAKLPTGRTRIARLHVRMDATAGDGAEILARFRAVVQAAADADGKKFEAKVQLAPASPADEAQNATGDDR